jgi:hypothetical protein
VTTESGVVGTCSSFLSLIVRVMSTDHMHSGFYSRVFGNVEKINFESVIYFFYF